MRLKGKMLERLSPEKRERMERTLRRMENVRRDDDMRVRELITAKKEWAEQERQKGLDLISKLEDQIEDIKKQIIKLDGCVLALVDLESDVNKMDDELKAQREIEAKQAEELSVKEPLDKDKKKVKPKKSRKRITKKK